MLCIILSYSSIHPSNVLENLWSNLRPLFLQMLDLVLLVLVHVCSRIPAKIVSGAVSEHDALSLGLIQIVQVVDQQDFAFDP